MGIINAAVLPDPVTADPRTSKPCSAIGMALRWMGVGLVKFIAWIARKSGRDKLRFKKEVVVSDLDLSSPSMGWSGAK